MSVTEAVRCPTCEAYPEAARWDPPSRHLTVRAATLEERRRGGVGSFWATGKPMRAPRYVVVDANDPTQYLGAFGMVDGGDTRAEAVFWAERWASKNDGHFIRPDGWAKVEGALPDD